MTTAFTAMLLFNHLPEIKADTIIAKLGTQFPELTGKTGTARSAAGSPNALVLTLDKEPVAVMNMPSPVPPGTLDRANQNNLIWPESARALAAHRAHVIVASLQKADTLAERLSAAASVTKVCAAIATLQRAIGLYWVPSECVNKAAFFLSAVERMSPTEWPVEIWIRPHLFADRTQERPYPIGCVTMGLEMFVGREIEFSPTAAMRGEIILQRTLNTAQYLLLNGLVIKDGDTLGIKEKERIRVQYMDKGRHTHSPVLKLSS